MLNKTKINLFIFNLIKFKKTIAIDYKKSLYIVSQNHLI